MLPVKHDGAVAVLKRITQEHIAVQEGSGSETTEFGGGGVKDGELKGFQSLWAHP